MQRERTMTFLWINNELYEHNKIKECSNVLEYLIIDIFNLNDRY